MMNFHFFDVVFIDFLARSSRDFWKVLGWFRGGFQYFFSEEFGVNLGGFGVDFNVFFVIFMMNFHFFDVIFIDFLAINLSLFLR